MVDRLLRVLMSLVLISALFTYVSGCKKRGRRGKTVATASAVTPTTSENTKAGNIAEKPKTGWTDNAKGEAPNKAPAAAEAKSAEKAKAGVEAKPAEEVKAAVGAPAVAAVQAVAKAPERVAGSLNVVASPSKGPAVAKVTIMEISDFQ